MYGRFCEIHSQPCNASLLIHFNGVYALTFKWYHRPVATFSVLSLHNHICLLKSQIVLTFFHFPLLNSFFFLYFDSTMSVESSSSTHSVYAHSH